MKNQESMLNESVITEVSYFTQSTKNSPFCSFNKPATQACMNHKCNKSAFLCFDKQCQCAKQHSKCFKITLESLIENIQQKQVFIDSLETCINNEIEEIIDLLSKYRDDTIKKMKKDFEFFGLNENEKQLMRELTDGKCEKTTGNKIWEIITHSNRKKECVTTMIEQTCKLLESNFKKAKQSFKSISQNAISTINLLDSQVLQFFNVVENKNSLINRDVDFSSSKILTSLNQLATIATFFNNKKIKSAKLLYRASQNEFLAKKFHQKCDGVADTLTLVETEFGKKIGGYTPIKWNSSQSYHYVEDESMSSFVFSLTNGDKFHLTNKEKAVQHDLNCGPVFGGGYDLFIYNKANQNTSSNANMNESYFNEKYKFNEKESWERLCGNPSSDNFKVKQWQLWSLSFE